MKTAIIAIALTASGNAFADGFAPWDNRDVTRDVVREKPAMVETSGFAPWESRDVVKDKASDAVAAKVTISAFRPWS